MRSAFLIELVKHPKIEATKVRVRWDESRYVPLLKNDPRFCSFDECLQIALDLLGQLPAWLEDKNHAEVLETAFECSVLPYEAPIDYLLQITEKGAHS